jgi:hypothetical protein
MRDMRHGKGSEQAGQDAHEGVALKKQMDALWSLRLTTA